MSEEKVKYGDILPIIRKDLSEDGLYEVLEVGLYAKKMANHKCVQVSATGIEFKDSSTYTEWAKAIHQLDAFGYAETVKACILKWFIGDALNAGERLFGEKASQIYGPELHWKPSYINNIRYVCRQVPKDRRTLVINNWKFWNFIAPMDPEDQQYMIDKAISIMHYSDWY